MCIHLLRITIYESLLFFLKHSIIEYIYYILIQCAIIIFNTFALYYQKFLCVCKG